MGYPRRAWAVAALAGLALAAGWAGTASAQLRASVSLVDDGSGAPLFTGPPVLAPGTSRSACLRVSATGASPGDEVRFAATDVTGALAAQLNVQVSSGSGGGHGDCTGFAGTRIFSGTLEALGDRGSGGVRTGWEPVDAASRSFRITVIVPGTAPAQAQGWTAGSTFEWRLLSAPGTDPDPPTGPVTPPTGAPAPAPVPAPTSDPSAVPSTDPILPRSGGSPHSSAGSAGLAGPSGSSPSAVVTPTAGAGTGAAAGGARRAGGPPGTAAGGGPDLRLVRPLPERVLNVLIDVVKHPAGMGGSLFVALVFLAMQYWIDRRDPKLAAASRTRRETLLVFPPVIPE